METYKYKNVTESGIIKNSAGRLRKFVINNHTNGTVQFYDGSEGGAAATSVLTSAGAMVPASHAISVFTSSGVVVEEQTITIGTKVYRAMAVPVQVNDVAMGDNAEGFIANLYNAINGTGVGDGTDYFAGTVAHTQVVATAKDATTLTIRGRVPGTSLNTVATTETFTNGSWADTTLGGGTGASNPGVTTAGAQFAINGRTYTAVVELSESLGAAAIADQILWVTSEAVFLDKIKLAINASGIAGTDYSTGTYPHADVYATTNTNTEQTIVAKKVGTGGNSITTTEALANYSWTSTVMAGGTGADGRKVGGLITFSATEREIDMGQLAFDSSLYATIGGAADLTVVYD